ncbi:hypothetical protein [Microvirga sp. VF16]|uniref:hypothetical protein n=1 Tax=Microvirga sp. VF16 TaxID=2807101 RepID=UPI00193D7E42|nr:hypothetical protein [Microvirga sp. VF16]QRM35591.1 hypothetical protein JO965_42960 [Microvirga sp. VF16]
MSVIPNDKGELPVSQEPGALPLFVIPWSGSAAFAWCSQLENAAIADVRVAGVAATVLERKKLLRPGQHLEVLLLDSVNLRDGAECELHVTSKDGEGAVVRAVARLARWDNPETRRALGLVANRFTQANGPAPVLERYLAFISAWQAPGSLVKAFPEGSILDVHAEHDGGQVSAYAVTAHGLQRVAGQVLHHGDGRLVLWLDGEAESLLYLELADTLVRLHLNERSPRHALSLVDTGANGINLVEALHAGIEQPSPELRAWAASLCRQNVVRPSEAAGVEVIRAVRLPSREVAIFLRITDAIVGARDLRLEAFGAKEPLAITIVAREVDGEGPQWQQQVIVKAPAPEADLGCVKLSRSYAGQSHAAWIREVDAADPRNAALARDFAPMAWVDPATLPTILHPLATAGGHAAPGLLQRLDLGSEPEQVSADIVVFVQQDLEALHRTVLALSLTLHDRPFAIHLCLFDPRLWPALEAKAQVWSRSYGLPLRLSCYSTRTTEAHVAQQAMAGTRPQVFCRAGVVLRRGDGLVRLLSMLHGKAATLLVEGTADPAMPRHDVSTVPQLADVVQADWPARIVLAALSSDDRLKADGMPQFYTLEGFLLAQAMASQSSEVVLQDAHDGDVVSSGTSDRPDDFETKLDRLSLQMVRRSSSAAQRRPRKATGRGTG